MKYQLRPFPLSLRYQNINLQFKELTIIESFQVRFKREDDEIFIQTSLNTIESDKQAFIDLEIKLIPLEPQIDSNKYNHVICAASETLYDLIINYNPPFNLRRRGFHYINPDCFEEKTLDSSLYHMFCRQEGIYDNLTLYDQ